MDNVFDNCEQTFGIKLQKTSLFMVWRFLGMINRKPDDLKEKSEFESISDTESELSPPSESDSPSLPNRGVRRNNHSNADKK